MAQESIAGIDCQDRKRSDRQRECPPNTTSSQGLRLANPIRDAHAEPRQQTGPGN